MPSRLLLRCSTASLRDALSTVIHAVPSRTPTASLECVLLEADQELRLTATDMEVQITSTCPATVQTPGTALVPAKRLWDVVRHLDKDEELSLEVADTTATLKTAYGTYSITGLDPQDFPTPDPGPAPTLELPDDALAHIIRHVLFAVSDDPIRPALTGVLLRFYGDALEAVATDGYRLSRLRLPLQSHAQGSCLVPAEVFRLLRHASSARVGWNEKAITFAVDGTTLVSRLIAEQFPNYENVIPTSSRSSCNVDRKAFLEALERVSLFAPTSVRIVRLHFRQGSITLQAEDETRGDRAQEVVHCQYEGEELLIGFNATYLTEALKAIEEDEVHLGLLEPSKPLVVRPGSAAPLPIAESQLVILVMPVRL